MKASTKLCDTSVCAALSNEQPPIPIYHRTSVLSHLRLPLSALYNACQDLHCLGPNPQRALLSSTSNDLPPTMSSTTDSSTQSPLQTLFNSFFMILCTEIGDKTFVITAILAMRHSRLRIFLGAISSLVIMSVLAAGMGALLPTLIPAHWTPVIAAVLFLVFGAKMLMEGRAMEDDGSGVIAEEMSEARKEIEVDDMVQDGFYLEGGVTLVDEKAEMGFSEVSFSDDGETYQIEATAPRPRCTPKGCLKGTRNLLGLFLGPVFVQAFVLPFVSEWGDRSQIATIALGAAHNVYLVSIGTILGHAVCTAMAVLGGRYIADKISVKKMTVGGAALFIVFGLLYVWEAYAAFSSKL